MHQGAHTCLLSDASSTVQKALIRGVQERVLDAVRDGVSLFFTGTAGSGKSFLLGHILEKTQALHGKHCVFLTATTGASAVAIGGMTLHSFGGIARGEGSAESLASR